MWGGEGGGEANSSRAAPEGEGGRAGEGRGGMARCGGGEGGGEAISPGGVGGVEGKGWGGID